MITDNAGRKYYLASEKEALLDQYEVWQDENPTLKIKEFCLLHKVPVSQFYDWRQVRRAGGKNWDSFPHTLVSGDPRSMEIIEKGHERRKANLLAQQMEAKAAPNVPRKAAADTSEIKRIWAEKHLRAQRFGQKEVQKVSEEFEKLTGMKVARMRAWSAAYKNTAEGAAYISKLYAETPTVPPPQWRLNQVERLRERRAAAKEAKAETNGSRPVDEALFRSLIAGLAEAVGKDIAQIHERIDTLKESLNSDLAANTAQLAKQQSILKEIETYFR